MNNKFMCVAGLHGNEPLPILALIDLGIVPVLGNKKALIEKKRFLQRDLNASFGRNGNSYEESRAREILKMIPKKMNVLDFHTFSCKSPPFCVLTNLDMLPLAARTGIRRVVYMKHNIKGGHALCDQRLCISVEVGRHDSAKSFTATQNVVKHLCGGQVLKQIELFEVVGIIKKKGNYTNFKFHQDGFVPVLAGEKAYNHYGLRALKPVKIDISTHA